MTTTLTTEESAALARRVYETIYNGTESFHGIGTHIAYLVGGILTGCTLSFFTPLEEDEQEFVDLLEDLFDENDQVWQYLRISNVHERPVTAECNTEDDSEFEDDCEIVDANTDF